MTITSKVIESMKQFAESYAKSTDTFFCSDLDVTHSVIQGLAANKETYGAPLCPCRYYDNKEDRQRYNNEYWALHGDKYKEERKIKRRNRKFKTVDKIIVYFN